MPYRYLWAPVAAVLLLASCATTKVGTRTQLQQAVPLDTAVLLSTVIGPVFQPTFPLVDAAAFNKKTNDLADDILAAEEAFVPEFRANLLTDLRERVPMVIVTSADFEGGDEVERLRVSGPVQTENKNFPVAYVAPGDLNVLSFDNGKNTARLFADDPGLRNRIATAIAAAGAQVGLLSYNRIAVLSAGAFGAIGTLRLETHVFVFGRRGQQIAEVYGVTKPLQVKGKDLGEYVAQLEQFPVLSAMMAEELTKYID